jgi:hypothetical protein
LCQYLPGTKSIMEPKLIINTFHNRKNSRFIMKRLNISYEKTQHLLWKNSTFIMKKLKIYYEKTQHLLWKNWWSHAWLLLSVNDKSRLLLSLLAHFFEAIRGSVVFAGSFMVAKPRLLWGLGCKSWTSKVEPLVHMLWYIKKGLCLYIVK